jgi:hypothetical protein
MKVSWQNLLLSAGKEIFSKRQVKHHQKEQQHFLSYSIK